MRTFAVDPPEFLDHEGAEIVLIAVEADAAEELGISLEPEHETVTTAEIFRDLKLEQPLHPPRAAVRGNVEVFEGTWK